MKKEDPAMKSNAGESEVKSPSMGHDALTTVLGGEPKELKEPEIRKVNSPAGHAKPPGSARV